MPESSKARSTWLARLVPWLLIGGLTLFHAVNNWTWLVQNVTWTGWDKARHLAWSLNYAQMLSHPTITSLFDVMVSDPIRPALFPASAAIMYGLFGRSADVAVMTNVIYLAIALAATYGIGQRWGGRWLGLVSAALLAFFPMFYSMSRYFYLEFALTAMVALSVYLLLATNGFQRRGMSLLFGLSLGLGLLTKRTFAVFAVGPLLAIILTSGLLPAFWQRLRRRPRIYWKKALIALLGGLVPAAIWYLPNREAVQGLFLGDALFLVWWGLAALAIYFATLPSAPLSNALAAVFLGAGLASTWYLARIEFLQRLAIYGYGIDDPRGRRLRLDSFDTYLYYLRKLGNEHLSFIIFFVLVAILVVAVAILMRRQGSVRQALRQIQPEGWVVLAWVGGSYTILTLSIYHETRAFTPVLPAIALLLGAGLLKLPGRRLRLGLLILLLGFGLLQFTILSYESAQKLVPSRPFTLPFWGRTTSFAQGVYIQLPDEGETDRGYWIEPDVLQRIEEQRLALERETISLGLLVNTSQINAGPFNYLMLTEYPQLRLESLFDQVDIAWPYARLFAHEFVIVKRMNEEVSPAQEQVIETILDGPPRLFDQAFELATTYLLPDGDTVYLYRQRYNLPANYPVEYITQLAEALGGQTRRDDAIILAPPQLVGPFVSQYTGPAEVYLDPVSEEDLADMVTRHPRIFLVLGDPAAGEVQSLAQEWLNRHAFRASHEWSDSLQLLTYATAAQAPATTPAVEVSAALGESIELLGYDLSPGPWHAGDIVTLTLFWQTRMPVELDYSVFVHLLDESSQLVTQNDSAPVGGSRPTSSWAGDEIIVDRRGLPLPDELRPGEYDLWLGMYLPASGERLPVRDANGDVVGDSLSLGHLTVTPR
jgi:4-amino-4-deoxy-L-arabinose transferase-like glycosyltransferase